jgi:Protein of unknown function (DUF3551)
MRTLACAILTIGSAVAAGQAWAQTYNPAFPVCMHVVPWGGAAYYDCIYYTMAQCAAAAAAGRAAQCDLNPYYAGARGSPKRNHRRHRQVRG